MKIGEVFKILNNEKNKNMRFFTTRYTNQFIIGFINPRNGKIVFRIFNLIGVELSNDSPILNKNSGWHEINKEQADVWLKGIYNS